MNESEDRVGGLIVRKTRNLSQYAKRVREAGLQDTNPSTISHRHENWQAQGHAPYTAAARAIEDTPDSIEDGVSTQGADRHRQLPRPCSVFRKLLSAFKGKGAMLIFQQDHALVWPPLVMCIGVSSAAGRTRTLVRHIFWAQSDGLGDCSWPNALEVGSDCRMAAGLCCWDGLNLAFAVSLLALQ